MPRAGPGGGKGPQGQEDPAASRGPILGLVVGVPAACPRWLVIAGFIVCLWSQVYFLKQHKKMRIRASTWSCLCFQLQPIAWDLKQKSVQMQPCEMTAPTRMETQASPCRARPAPSCHPRHSVRLPPSN